MIRRTPQEIADFFGCYVAETESGFWFMIRHKPSLENGEWITRCGLPYDIDSNIVEAPADHDWTHLYEPQMVSAETAHTTEAPHLGEVYAHKEYRIVTAHKEIDSEVFSKGVMAWIERGWRPAGGISFDKHGCPYQAMVRGV